MSPTLDARQERFLRDLAPQVLGAVIRRFRDFSASEDAVQEALIAAATQWPREGLPDEPRAWLYQVASRRIADHVRAETARRRREAIVVSLVPPELQIALAADDDDTPEEHDDTLVLLFMCCHPALSPSSAIALTLRAAGGLTTAEIATAFLVPEATMAQRISRAKQSIKASGVPFQLPTLEERDQRLGAVLHVLYLIFNEGYTTSSGPALHRSDLSGEATRLTRTLHALLPDHAETAGLLPASRPPHHEHSRAELPAHASGAAQRGQPQGSMISSGRSRPSIRRPIPFTRSRSSGRRKRPSRSRNARIAFARVAPIPGNRRRSCSLARLIATLPSAVTAAPASPPSPAPASTVSPPPVVVVDVDVVADADALAAGAATIAALALALTVAAAASAIPILAPLPPIRPDPTSASTTNPAIASAPLPTSGPHADSAIAARIRPTTPFDPVAAAVAVPIFFFAA